MEHLKLLATLLPLSLTAGINLYATVAMVGICARYDLIQDMPQGLEVFSNPFIIGLAVVLYIIEFVVDKFEFFDNAWDVISTFIRPLGAFAMASAALGDTDPSMKVAGALVCSAVALQSHTGKAGARVALNIASPAETVSNSIISIIEDLFVFVTVWLALNYPKTTAVAAAVIIAFLIVITPRLFRWSFFFLKSVFVAFGSWFHSQKKDDVPPSELMELVGHADTETSIHCNCSGISGIRGRGGYLVLLEDKLVFLYKRYLMTGKWEINRSAIQKAYLRRRLFIDILEIPYTDEKGRKKAARFAFLKTKTLLAEKLAERLNSKTPPVPDSSALTTD